MKNKQFLLASRPVGTPTRKNWDFVENDVADLLDNQVLVQVEFISLDPAMRGWMNDGKSYIEPVQIGGDYVYGHCGVKKYYVECIE